MFFTGLIVQIFLMQAFGMRTLRMQTFLVRIFLMGTSPVQTSLMRIFIDAKLEGANLTGTILDPATQGHE